MKNRHNYIIATLLLFISLTIQAQTIVYVDAAASGADNGTSWVNAYKNLQTAIDAAALSAPAQVWVKAGTYKPTSGTDRTISFIMKNDVEIYGGFVGTETLLAQRDWVLNQTILSGDIGVLNDNTDNSKVVIHNSNFPSTPLTLSAKLDGFIVEDGYLDDPALMGGAGMRNNNSSPTIMNCTFRDNVNTQIANAGTRGGAILNVSESSPVIQSSIFYNNSARSGGAIAFRATVVYPVESYIINCLFYNNTSHYLGGAIYVENHGVSLINNTIVNNTNTGSQSLGWGGGIYYQSINGAAAADFVNNIVWDNTALISNDIYLAGTQNFPTFTTNIVKSYNNSNPNFTDSNNNDYTLNYCNSPAIDAGTNSFIPASLTLDLVQNGRIHNTTVDIGAYESQFAPTSFSAIETTDISCFNAADGVVSMNGGGGSGTLTYSVDGVNYTTNSVFSGLDIGTYNLYVKDANDCIATSQATLTQPTAMIISASSTNISCNGANDGTITINASGSSGTYQYKLNAGTFQSSNIFNNLSAGNYNVTIRDQGTPTCSVSTSTITITEPAVIVASVSKTDVTCNGADDGIISFTTSGGTGAVGASIDGTNFQTGDFTGLAPANYTVTFKDENNCTVFINTTITEPTAISTSVATTDLTCAGSQSGKIVVTASGGTAPLEYSIDGANFQSSATFSSLDGGSYTITTKDANSCTTTDNVTLTEPDALVLTTTVSDISCNGLVDGSIGVSASGGTSAYTFSMDGVNFSAVTSFDNLAAGDYTITLKDANGCEAKNQVTITEPAVIAASVSKTDVTCNGADDGIISFTTSGGTGTVEASIDGTNFQTGDFTGLAPNNYTITFKDANGCTLANMESINEPIALTATLTVTDLTCPPGAVSGRISIAAVGGTAPYEYSIDGANFQTAPIFSLAEGGNYEITIRDANGCSIIENTTVNQPDAFAFSTVLTDIACNGETDGSISVTASGGTSPYEYSMDGTNFSTTGDYTGLAAGSYTIHLLDANACSYTEDFTIIQPDELTVTASFNGTNVDLTATGGASPYTYSSDGTNFQSEASFTLPNGNYTFTVKDGNGCEATTTEQLLITGIELGENINSIEMYPNPALNSINLSNIEKIKRVEIRSVSGKLVYEAELRGSTSSIDISDFKGGSYLLLLTKANGEVLRKRFIKN